MNSCLLVIDVQNGFISDRTAHIPPKIKTLLKDELFDCVAFTKFTNTHSSPYVRFLGWNKVSAGEETEISPLIKPFAKNTFYKDTYTAITKEVDQFLENHSISTAFICGIDTDACVLATAIDLFELGIRPYVLAHYSASNGGPDSQKAAITVLSRLIGSHNIISCELNQNNILKYRT